MVTDRIHLDKREFSRVDTHPAAVVHATGSEESIHGQVLDVSLGGAYIEGEFSLTEGTEVAVTILLGGEETGVAINAGGIVARTNPGGVAIIFHELRDPESYGHLRKLVLYNAEATVSIAEEIRDHRGIVRENLPSGSGITNT